MTVGQDIPKGQKDISVLAIRTCVMLLPGSVHGKLGC